MKLAFIICCIRMQCCNWIITVIRILLMLHWYKKSRYRVIKTVLYLVFKINKHSFRSSSFVQFVYFVFIILFKIFFFSQYYYIPYNDNKPCVWVRSIWQDHRRRMYNSNVLAKIADKLVKLEFFFCNMNEILCNKMFNLALWLKNINYL